MRQARAKCGECVDDLAVHVLRQYERIEIRFGDVRIAEKLPNGTHGTRDVYHNLLES